MKGLKYIRNLYKEGTTVAIININMIVGITS